MGWFWLLLSGVSEAAWAISLKQTEGMTRLGPTMLMMALLLLTLWLNAMALRDIPMAIAYAVWTSVALAATLGYDWMFLQEPLSAQQVAFLLLIATGVGGLIWLEV